MIGGPMTLIILVVLGVLFVLGIRMIRQSNQQDELKASSPPRNKRICPNCDTKNRRRAKFCANCGQRLE